MYVKYNKRKLMRFPEEIGHIVSVISNGYAAFP